MRGKSAANSVGANVHECRVLIAATEPLIWISDELRSAGLIVLEARSANEALALAAEHAVVLLISHITLSDMSAVELARTAFERHALYSVLIAESDDATDASIAEGVIARVRRTENPMPLIRAVLPLVREIKAVRAREQELRAALAAERDINTAIGVLMERLQVSRENAFERLRGYARSKRQRVAELSRALLSSAAESQRIAAELMGTDAIARNNTGLDD